MAKHIELGIRDKIGALKEKVIGDSEKAPKEGKTAVDIKKNIIEWALRTATTRIVMARNVNDLSNQLKDVSQSLVSGQEISEVDGLRAAVMQKVAEVVTSDDEKNVSLAVDDLLKKGDVAAAVKYLEDRSKDDKYKMAVDQQKEVDGLLNAVKDLDNEKSPDEKVIKPKIDKVEVARETVTKKAEKEFKEIRVKNEEIESNIARENIEEEKIKIGAKAKPKVEGKVERDDVDTKKIATQVKSVVSDDKEEGKKDRRTFDRYLSGGRDGFGTVDATGKLTIDFERLSYKEAKAHFARINLLRQKYKVGINDASNKELKSYLDQMQFELYERLHSLEVVEQEKVVENILTPGDEAWNKLSPEEKNRIRQTLEFANKYNDPEDLVNLQRGGAGYERPKSVLQDPRLGLEKYFDFNGTEPKWKGTPQEFFEVCRAEIYKIKNIIPEERLNQLAFEPSARVYMALMGVDTTGAPELKKMKDAVTKTMYIQFVVKSMWKAGGNDEMWARAAGMMTREGAEESFFQLMQVRESLKARDKEGKTVELSGFNIDDIMTLAELEAPNGKGQLWLPYLSGRSNAVNKQRLNEFGIELARHTIQEEILRADKKTLTPERKAQLARNMQLLDSGELKLDDEQLLWARDYLHYLEVATLNAGEKGRLLNASTKPGEFLYAHLPLGEFAQKTGVWALNYFGKYKVTKYSLEFLGKLFVPNVGLLSYARGETMGHFLNMESSEEIGMFDRVTGEYVDTGAGAKDFFFSKSGASESEIKNFNAFWQEMLFDSRTSKDPKASAARSMVEARKKGAELLGTTKDLSFIDKMDFKNLEGVVGHEILQGESNRAKFEWVVKNFGYKMMRKDVMASKREGDWVNKYVPKYYVEVYKGLMAFLNSPTLANKIKITELIEGYISTAAESWNEQADEAMKSNREATVGLKTGGKWYKPMDYFGAEVPDGEWKQDGDHMTMGTKRVSPTEGWHFGSGFAWSRQELKEGTRDPMIMEKISIDNAYYGGLMSRKEWGEKKKEWQRKIYLGDVYKIKMGKDKDGNDRTVNFRLGYIPIFTPYLALRGWWVDRMGMDFEDFLMITRKQNEETWAKLKKLLGIEV